MKSRNCQEKLLFFSEKGPAGRASARHGAGMGPAGADAAAPQEGNGLPAAPAWAILPDEPRTAAHPNTPPAHQEAAWSYVCFPPA